MRNLSSKQAIAKAITKAVKEKVHQRDDGLCLWCKAQGRYVPGIPEAHYIARSHGGMGIEENILSLCRKCHDAYDNGPREQREKMKAYFGSYLSSKYWNWDEEKLIYHKYGGV